MAKSVKKIIILLKILRTRLPIHRTRKGILRTRLLLQFSKFRQNEAFSHN